MGTYTASVIPPPGWVKRQPFGEEPIKRLVDPYKLAGIPHTMALGLSDGCPPRNRVVSQET
jgi:hypothetical protein